MRKLINYIKSLFEDREPIDDVFEEWQEEMRKVEQFQRNQIVEATEDQLNELHNAGVLEVYYETERVLH